MSRPLGCTHCFVARPIGSAWAATASSPSRMLVSRPSFSVSRSSCAGAMRSAVALHFGRDGGEDCGGPLVRGGGGRRDGGGARRLGGPGGDVGGGAGLLSPRCQLVGGHRMTTRSSAWISSGRPAHHFAACPQVDHDRTCGECRANGAGREWLVGGGQHRRPGCKVAVRKRNVARYHHASCARPLRNPDVRRVAAVVHNHSLGQRIVVRAQAAVRHHRHRHFVPECHAKDLLLHRARVRVDQNA